jgi:hypothetical protein
MELLPAWALASPCTTESLWILLEEGASKAIINQAQLLLPLSSLALGLMMVVAII